MVKCYKIITGYGNYRKTLKQFNKITEPVYILFTGNRKGRNMSWCKNCIHALPIIIKRLKRYAPKCSHFLRVEVGDRPSWKSWNNPFRCDPDLYLEYIPTLLQLRTDNRLDGYECEDRRHVKDFFTYIA